MAAYVCRFINAKAEICEVALSEDLHFLCEVGVDAIFPEYQGL